MTYRPSIRVDHRPTRYRGFRSKGCYAISAVDADYNEPVGKIDVCVTRIGSAFGHVERLKVGGIHVAEGYRRHGIGTLLYEAAARLACSKNIPLASDNLPALSRYSKGFWEKQEQKGRAVRVGSGELREFVLRSPCGADLSGARARGRGRGRPGRTRTRRSR